MDKITSSEVIPLIQNSFSGELNYSFSILQGVANMSRIGSYLPYIMRETLGKL